MLWRNYVFRRGPGVHELWERLFEERSARVLYITGRGFDVRSQLSIRAFVDGCRLSGHRISKAELLLVGFPGYQLGQELIEQTEANARELERIFSSIGTTAGVN